MRAQEAALREVANSKLRRILAHNQTIDSMELAAGEMAISSGGATVMKTSYLLKIPR